MKRLLALLLLASSGLAAEPAAPLLVQPGAVISQPDLRQALGAEWSVAKGRWEPKEGVLLATELPDEHHAAVLHLATGPVSLVWECEFRLKGGKVFYVGCDGARHVGRLVITPKNARLCEDSTEVKGVSPSHTLAEAPLDLQPEEWQRLRVEYTGSQMAARINDRELKAEHEYLATPKVRWWFASSGATVEIRNIRISQGVPPAPK
ncbi:MAG TPA: hypothetical protein VGO11_04445 [Chthoniobacteraceae bacterium]|jgi:hypothetical protein|nr:hypothetical protein [Chthoniobacteraceae bacterium]